MQQRYMVSLLQDNYTTINVRFYREDEAPQANSPIAAAPAMQTAGPAWGQAVPPPPPAYRQQTERLYVYKALLSSNVKAGDTVVVEVARGLVLTTVESVDESPRIDVDATFGYTWIVDKVDLTAYHAQLAAEENFRVALQAVERKKQQNRVKHELMQLHADDPEALGLFESAVQSLTVGQNPNGEGKEKC